MKRLFKTFILCLAMMATFALVACDSSQGAPNVPAVDINIGQNDIADTTQTRSSIAEVTTALTNNLTNEQKNSTLPLEYSSSVYTISTAGDYYFSGELTGAISVSAVGSVHIYLDGVTLAVANKAISSGEGSQVVITLIGNNTISNTSKKNLIDSAEDLVINGNGTLTLTSGKSAISCDKTFIGLGGTINATASNHIVTADSIYIDGMTINAVSCGKDALHAESDYDDVQSAPEFSFSAGFVFIKSGTISTTTVADECFQADSFVYIKDGTFNLNSTANSEGKGIKVGEIDYAINSEEGIVESNQYTILIEGGTFNINTTSDAIHCNSGSIIISGGTFEIETEDDAIHADVNLKISGNAEINIITCYEGLEAETIDISGGDITIRATDDGVNATNSTLTENEQKQICQINISGGRLDVTVSPNGDRDGIDSNGGIKITGGVVITRGPNSEVASPMDASNYISISGGIVIVIGNSLGSGGRFSGPGGRPDGNPGANRGEGVVSSTLVKTQSSTSGLSIGNNHSVIVGDTTISYSNAYAYSGYTTVYASSSATIN